MDWAPRVLAATAEAAGVVDVSTDREQGGLQANVVIDRVAAARLGVRMQDIDNALNNAFAQRQVSTLYTQRNQYRVILEIDPHFQRDPTDLAASLRPRRQRRAGAAHRGHQDRPRRCRRWWSTTRASSRRSPSASTWRRTSPSTQATRRSTARSPNCICPTRCTPNSPGDARAYRQSIGAQPLLILAALIAVYIVLGVLYESLAHPLTIISTLPSAGLGALLALQMFSTELSLIAFIGIILLIGIVKKNGIMMVDFALDAERKRGLPPEQAIFEACLERFRPILMTTLAALLGALPLVIATGPGLGAAPAARHHHRRRADRLADADALHHAGDLPAARPAAPPAVGRGVSAREPGTWIRSAAPALRPGHACLDRRLPEAGTSRADSASTSAPRLRL